MSDVRFNCPVCAGHLVVDASAGGSTIACPRCSNQIVIPSAAAAGAVESARGVSKGSGRSSVTILLLLIFLVGAGSWLFMSRPGHSKPVGITKTDSTANHAAAAPAQLSEEFLMSYFARKGHQATSIADELKLTAPAELRNYFEAGARGDWRTAKQIYGKLWPRVEGGNMAPHPITGTPAAQPVLETVMVRDVVEAWGPKWASRYAHDIMDSIPRGSVYFGGTDQGRGLITASCKSHEEGVPFFTVTQNGLADRNHTEYLRLMYGKQLKLLTPEDIQKAVDDYRADAGRRLDAKQLRPGEEVRRVAGKMEFGGFGAAAALNAALAKLLFERNPDRDFFVEESFPLDWMYPHLCPNGPIMKVNRQPMDKLPEEILSQDREYWNLFTRSTVGDWLKEETPISILCEQAKAIYLGQDPAGFKVDRAFFGKTNTTHTPAAGYSKLRSGIGGLYAYRASSSSNSAEKERMRKEADFAFRQAFALCPYSPEAAFRLANLLLSDNRKADAVLVIQTAADLNPNEQLRESLARLKSGRT